MKESEIGKPFDEVGDGWSAELEAIEVDRRKCDGRTIIRRVVAVEALVSTYISSDPCIGHSLRVGVDGLLEILNYLVNCAEPFVFENKILRWTWWFWR